MTLITRKPLWHHTSHALRMHGRAIKIAGYEAVFAVSGELETPICCAAYPRVNRHLYRLAKKPE